MTSIVNHLDLEAKLALIRAHPDLGSKAKMAEASVQEQAGVVCLRASLSKEFPLYIDIIRLRPTRGRKSQSMTVPSIEHIWTLWINN